MGARINNNGFRISNRSYHRKGAHGIQLGHYGIKRMIRGFSPYSYVKGLEDLELDSLESISLNQFSQSEINLILGGKPKWIPLNADTYLELNRERMREYNLELKRFTIRSRNRLIEAITADEECLAVMRRRRSRIVDTVWVILDARIQSSVSAGGQLRMEMEPVSGIFKLKGQTGGQRSREIDLEIGEDTVFAYRMLRPQFSGRRRDGTLDFLRADYQGLF